MEVSVFWFKFGSLSRIDQSYSSRLETVHVECKRGLTHWPKCNLGTERERERE